MNKKAAFVICAYKCADFIPDLLFGLRNQVPVAGWDIEIRIGVDACIETARALKKHKQPYYWSNENVGHAILRNSLMYVKPADAFMYFDADDQTFKSYSLYNLQALKYKKIIMPAKLNCDVNLKPHWPARVENGGAMTFGSELLEAIGGFAPYRCAIDTDLMRRAEGVGFEIIPINTALYYRRSHPGALTKRVDTGMGSPYRKQVWASMCADREKGIFKIDPVTVKLELR